jgi:hypothetical protein
MPGPNGPEFQKPVLNSPAQGALQAGLAGLLGPLGTSGDISSSRIAERGVIGEYLVCPGRLSHVRPVRGWQHSLRTHPPVSVKEGHPC